MRHNAGFTLVELLVVAAIMGLVVMGIYSVFLSMNKSTYKQEEVVEVMQNLRVAMGRISRDIRMAGFLIPLTDTPLSVAGQNTLTIQTATVSGRIAQVDTDFNSSSATMDVDIATAEMVDLFETGDSVRIIRPVDREQPLDTVFTVTGKDRTGPTLTLSGFTLETFREGDIVVEVSGAASIHPETLTYQLQTDGNLERNGEIVGSYLTELAFEYLREDGSALTTPVAAGDLDDIRAVRVTLTGATDPVKTALTGGVISRQLTQVIRIRN